MPNWCMNSLTVTGTEEEVEALIAKVSTSESLFSFAKIVPLPSEEDDWNMWCNLHWGTKWDVDCQDLDTYKNGTLMDASWIFDTAWSPPIQVIEKLAEDNLNLIVSLSYDEPGNNFGGEITWEYGVIIHQAEFESPTVASWEEEEGFYEDFTQVPEKKCKR